MRVKFLKPMGLLMLNMGIDIRRIIATGNIFKYLKQSIIFRKMGGDISRFRPILVDYADQAGMAKGHYFHQDLLVASFIYNKNPDRHVDIGSRIDGFVAHVASFRRIDVIDIRDLKSIGHENIHFVKADLMSESNIQRHSADSISCLHAIEHFGLGRYGDPIDPDGHIKGLKNIAKILKPGGFLYISFPIGKKTEVYFNAHRVFEPKAILEFLPKDSGLSLVRFDFVDDFGDLHRECDLLNDRIELEYGCGIYSFQKSNR